MASAFALQRSTTCAVKTYILGAGQFIEFNQSSKENSYVSKRESGK